MKSPLASGVWIELDEVESTQVAAKAHVASGEEPKVGVLFAHHQTAGVGRFEREWYSERGHSMTASLIFWDYADHPKGWLIGMNLALAVAGAVHCRVSWPNDLLLGGKKVGGVLTHMVEDPKGRRVPVIGIGLNLGVLDFPGDLSGRAGNVEMGSGDRFDPKHVCEEILERVSLLPEPNEWHDLKSVWSRFDETAGKRYTLPDGQVAIGIGIGPQGELICSLEGETTSVLAADAIFGPA
ncbi:MAG: biotin--[acetyl-CoA-carboxylase] ligase [Chthonomonas sp.]|nr:biotin--[acetyl-CoA-carboxylase] ligase [Chthonomonas sp.]